MTPCTEHTFVAGSSRSLSWWASGSSAPGRSPAPSGPTAMRVQRVSQRTYVVRQGDTLWAIASRIAPAGDPRPVIQAIQDANGVDAGSLVPGAVLRIPALG